MRWYALFLTAVVLLGCNEPLSFDQAMKLYNQKDYASAVNALSLLAEGGDYRAQLVLGRHFLQADSKDGAKSARYFKMAVDQGDIDALFFLGRAYLNGEGVPQNPTMGEEYLVRAGNAGSTAALITLGIRYSRMMSSIGSAEHGKKALVLFQNAFLYGDELAAPLISSIYMGGL
ncbi:tetratricopeptide repeat protein [Pseudomonas chlororaphis]|uniref:tetratricopeptide repeat protein n=1 Tax=Pseudomonas chlororaphis TaxID=587753 RepID=UPI000F5856CA|nr:tetratricopeptide repeat protein [Pseudomonas chlororaphis]